MANDAVLQVRMDAELKRDAEDLYRRIGEHHSYRRISGRDGGTESSSLSSRQQQDRFLMSRHIYSVVLRHKTSMKNINRAYAFPGPGDPGRLPGAEGYFISSEKADAINDKIRLLQEPAQGQPEYR